MYKRTEKVEVVDLSAALAIYEAESVYQSADT
jgi:hypothetical protein